MPLAPHLGPYEMLAPIGAGGMGEVYLAKDTRLDRTVAIKVLPGHLADYGAARLEREARAVSSLNHPHICILQDIGHQDSIDSDDGRFLINSVPSDNSPLLTLLTGWPSL